MLFGSATTPAATTHSFARARQLSREAIHTPTQNTQAVPLNEQGGVPQIAPIDSNYDKRGEKERNRSYDGTKGELGLGDARLGANPSTELKLRDSCERTQELSVPTRNSDHAMQVIIEKIGLRLRFAPAGLPISSIEGDGINDEQNGNRRRYGEQRSHAQKSRFKILNE